MSLRVRHKMPTRVIAEKVNLSQNTVQQVLRQLTDHEFALEIFGVEKTIAQTLRTFAVKKSIAEMVEGGKDLLTVPYVKNALEEKNDIYLSRYKVRKAVTRDCGLVYRRVGSIESYVNSRKNVILRQLMASHLAKNIFAKGKIVCNFDECTFSESTSRAYSYAPRGKKMARTYKKSIPNINLFMTIIDDGTRIVQFTTGSNNQVTFIKWLFDFARFMDKHRPGFRETHRILMDNMTGHKTPLSISVINHLGLPITFTAPASMTAMPIERMFGLVKLQTINTTDDTTKR
jgi:hypothetical protein